MSGALRGRMGLTLPVDCRAIQYSLVGAAAASMYDRAWSAGAR